MISVNPAIISFAAFFCITAYPLLCVKLDDARKAYSKSISNPLNFFCIDLTFLPTTTGPILYTSEKSNKNLIFDIFIFLPVHYKKALKYLNPHNMLKLIIRDCAFAVSKENHKNQAKRLAPNYNAHNPQHFDLI